MQKKIIDPNAKTTSDSGIFGLPYSEKESQVIYLPITWDVTTSYQSGTSMGPKSILKASSQIDFFDLDYQNAYECGLFMRNENLKIKKLNIEGRKLAKTIIDSDEISVKKNKNLQNNLIKVNKICEELNQIVFKETTKLLAENKIPVIVGGDHATPFGAIAAYAEKYPGLGILHFDAHSDTRVGYMGFENSHASIMYNVIEKIPNIKKLVQVGIRDFCDQEYTYTKNHKKIKVYFDQHLATRVRSGENFIKIAKEIVSQLPQKIYISFDIDGLDPRYCPNTGTPVPGGLEYHDVMTILSEIVRSGKELVGFDLVEVAPHKKDKSNEWDANVGMRLLYKLTSTCLASLNKIKLRK